VKPSRRRTDPLPEGATPAAGGEVPLILVVDDYEDNREMYSQYLEFTGLRVAEAANGKEALAKAAEVMPDLIVMDLSLPGVDGWEATRTIKRDPKLKDVLVLALTGHALEGASQSAKDAGCDGFLTKPCLPEDLHREIERMLGAPRARAKAKTRR
jgi:two-component system cell cycle response regulator DivK